MKVTKTIMALAVVKRALRYNFVEVTMIVGFIIGYTQVEHLPLGVLWPGFILAALWVCLASTSDAQQHAFQMVIHRYLFITDTLTGVFLLSVLAFLTRGEQWQFPVMYLVAAAQHLRYTYLTFQWLVDESKLKERIQDDYPDDNM